MPSIIPSPGSPGSPNVFATIPLDHNISVGAGQRLYTTTAMNQLFDHTVTLGTEYFTFSNAGTIWITSTGIARLLFPFNFGAVTNSGLMVASSNGGDASYVLNVFSTWQGGLNNSGRMFALSTTGDAATIVDSSQGSTITNSGIIAAQGAIDVGAITRNNGGPIINTTTGQILAEGANAYAILIGNGHFSDTPGYYDLSNAGRIEAASTNASNASVAVLIQSLSFIGIENSGTITGDYAIYVDEWSPNASGVDRIVNYATGHINGDIYLGANNDLVDNAGQIVGDVLFGIGDDVFHNAGQLVGVASLGWGQDSFDGGSSADAAIGDRGNDALSGGAGNDLLLGGRGDDTIAGGAGNDGLYGEFGNDVITTSGGDRVVAGVGDDVVVLTDLTFADVDGGAGNDTLVLPNLADILDLQMAIASGRLHGFETIELPGAQELVVRAADVAALTGGAQQLLVTTTAAGRVDLIGSWIAGAPVTINGVDYAAYVQGATTVLIGGAGAVAFLDTPPPGAAGLDAVAAGSVAPLPGSTAGANLTVSVTQMGTGMAGPSVIEADEIWTSNVGGGTSGYDLVNYGQVTSSGNGSTGARAMDYMISNYGSISATVTGDSANLSNNISLYNTYGVYNCIQTFISNAIAAHGFVENHGTITASSQASIAVASFGANGTNFGTLSASSSQFVAVGAFARDGGFYNNVGDINATGQFEAYGVVAATHPLTLNNSGNITVSATGVGAHSIGVYLFYSTGTQQIVNTGVITAEIAIRTDQMVNGNGLVLDNSGEIHGRIELNLQGGGVVGARQDVVINGGLIDGEIHMGGERDLYLGASGTQAGGVFGEDGFDFLKGGNGTETLNGGAGDDAISGGGGADMLTGGAGADIFAYSAATDSSAGASDTITDFQSNLDRIDLSGLAPSAITLDFAAGVTTLTAVAAGGVLVVHIAGSVTSDDLITAPHSSITGTSSADLLLASIGGSTLAGGDGDDMLIGSDGEDVLNGGAGFDVMVGGGGNDTYYVEYGEESIRELAGAGVDTILLNPVYPAAYYLPDNVENLVLTAGWDGVGNALDNIITGNANANKLDGAAGADTLIGGLGNDSYYVDDALDLVVEDVNSGTDIVFATSTYVLAANIENLTLVENSGSINGSGNAMANVITGNESNNIIYAGAGADAVHSGAGADELYGEDGADELNAQGGNDTAHGGAGDDTIWGESGSDTIYGDAGADHLSGAAPLYFDPIARVWRPTVEDDLANDTLWGGDGDDDLTGGGGSDVLNGGAGVDTAVYVGVLGVGVVASLVNPNANTNEATGDTYVSIENLQGSSYADALTGDANANILWGDAGDDTLNGGDGDDTLNGGAGADNMQGGAGADTYVVDNTGDVVTESGVGVDLVQASITFQLTAGIENLTLTGAGAITGYGNALNNIITGNGAANALYGFDGADTLDGAAGVDSMFGGNGDDVYYVDNAGDQTTEVSALGGTDTVFASVTRNLTANIENLTLTGAAAITGAGNTLNNAIIGNSAANTLYGFDGNDRLDGGAGADTLFGANGDDVYVVDDVGDITVEGSALGGIDTVETYISRNMNANFENMILLGSATIAYGNVLGNVLTGNGLSNSLYGFDGNDTLDGGAGADQMFGAGGDDTYIVDNSGDVTSEVSALGGNDTVLASVTRNLTANLENLVLTGSANITGAGNALNNVITGNDGNNTLYGLAGADRLDGGLGADTLQGGADADEYVFSTALGGGNVDAIVGFSVADDTIVLNNSVFTGLSAGALGTGEFVIGASAADADDHIIYDSATGALYFDADGDGAGAAVMFATLTAGLALTSNDFIVSGP